VNNKISHQINKDLALKKNESPNAGKLTIYTSFFNAACALYQVMCPDDIFLTQLMHVEYMITKKITLRIIAEDNGEDKQNQPTSNQ
jgi:hypothetical protein